MSTRSTRFSSPATLLASLVLLACDPTDAGRSEPLPGSHPKSSPEVLVEGTTRDAVVVVRPDGAIEIYDRRGELRAQIIDPQARFQSALAPMTGVAEWAKPHPQLSVPLAGLADRLTRGAREQRARDAEGSTDPQRLMIAIAEAAESVDDRLAALDGELAQLWADTSKPAAERRRLLFERWDECEETDGAPTVARIERAADAPDTIRKHAGERARATIERFVRTRLPASDGDGYTPDELARLNRGRASRRAFAPYH